MSYKNGLFFFHVLYSYARISMAPSNHRLFVPFTFVDNLGLGIWVLGTSFGDCDTCKLMLLQFPTFQLNSSQRGGIVTEWHDLRLTYCPSRPLNLRLLRAPWF